MESKRYVFEKKVDNVNHGVYFKITDTKTGLKIDDHKIQLDDYSNRTIFDEAIQVVTDEMQFRCNALNFKEFMLEFAENNLDKGELVVDNKEQIDKGLIKEIDLNFNQDKKVVDDFLSKFDKENLENSDKQLIDEFVDNNYYGEKNNPYEVIKITNNLDLNFNRGNVLKYILRAGKKDANKEIQDLQKAKHYIDYEIERLKIMNNK